MGNDFIILNPTKNSWTYPVTREVTIGKPEIHSPIFNVGNGSRLIDSKSLMLVRTPCLRDGNSENEQGHVSVFRCKGKSRIPAHLYPKGCRLLKILRQSKRTPPLLFYYAGQVVWALVLSWVHQNRASPFASDFYCRRRHRKEFCGEDHFYREFTRFHRRKIAVR